MHESRLFTALPLFTDSIEVKKAGRIRSAAGVMVYGLKKEPKLKRAKPWHADLKDIVVLPNQYRSDQQAILAARIAELIDEGKRTLSMGLLAWGH
ncbi:hypothetical protein CBR_g30915 [Chara braunii]|uniref:Uncharacterized protein n=1 Tax=Chara braunii TaxID=69332 RepID=A0A388LDR8_CHABU|nr:hypothetical protein CBR_g30915 [Chara braunii]|eukprot:GBG80451.1 hypothetical protein CBR_g30915 [Chara braunii]